MSRDGRKVILAKQEIIDHGKEKGIDVEVYTQFSSTASPFFHLEEARRVVEKFGVFQRSFQPSYNVFCGRIALPKSLESPGIESNDERDLLPTYPACCYEGNQNFLRDIDIQLSKMNIMISQILESKA